MGKARGTCCRGRRTGRIGRAGVGIGGGRGRVGGAGGCGTRVHDVREGEGGGGRGIGSETGVTGLVWCAGGAWGRGRVEGRAGSAGAGDGRSGEGRGGVDRAGFLTDTGRPLGFLSPLKGEADPR